MVASWHFLGLALPAAAQVNRSSHFLSRQSVDVSSNGVRCGGLDLPENAGCKQVVEWAAGGGKWDSSAGGWYRSMPTITGVSHEQGNLQDFQRLYYCSPPGTPAVACPRARVAAIHLAATASPATSSMPAIVLVAMGMTRVLDAFPRRAPWATRASTGPRRLSMALCNSGVALVVIKSLC
eukprot:s3064_g6.t1